jgi:hypothetical protein
MNTETEIPVETIKKNKTPQNILDSISKYQKNNKDKINEKSRNYYNRVKQDPVRYAHLKERLKKNKVDLALKKKLLKDESEIENPV